MVGDIAGKGIAAALLMANLQANLRGQCAIALERPQQFLESVNQLFFENTIESAYATLFFAEYDTRAHGLRYANCGHLPGLILRGERYARSAGFHLHRSRSLRRLEMLHRREQLTSWRHSGALHRRRNGGLQ